MNKKIAAYIVVPILGLALLGGGVALAATNSTGTNPMSALVTAIAQKFNLNPSDVQAVVNQVHTDQKTAMTAKMQQLFSDRLTQAVTDKKLTQAQADLINAKRAELQSFEQSLNGKTPAEKQAALKTEMASLKQWSTDNNIPQGFLMTFGGRRMGRGFGHMGWNTTKTPTPPTPPTNN